VAYPTDSGVERVAKSVVQTPERGVEQYINKIIAEQAKVNEFTRLIDAECMLKLFFHYHVACHYQQLTQTLVVLEHITHGVQNIQDSFTEFNTSKPVSQSKKRLIVCRILIFLEQTKKSWRPF
jgi:hypothetical protein